MRVVGLDLSLTSSGVAEIGTVMGLPTLVEVSRVRSAGKKDDTLAMRAKRLRELRNGVVELLDPGMDGSFADLVVVENPSYGSKFGSPHDRSGLWWDVVGLLLELEVPVATVAPQGRAKYGTGKGNADKATVFEAVRTQYPSITFASDDEADALILAAMGARWLGKQIDPWLDGKPEHLSAMDGASWPS